MPDIHKDIVITPNRGQTGQPQIAFTGFGNTTITLKVLDDTFGTLSWEGSQGQVFAINNNLSSGSIFSVNDISGLPVIDANANGNIAFAGVAGTTSGFVGVGITNPTAKLEVKGDLNGTAFESYELDDLSSATTSFSVVVESPTERNDLINTFVPTFNYDRVTITNPFRLMITVNGVLQSAFINNTDYVYQSNFLGSNNGFTIDTDNNIKFTESIPSGSDIVARVLPVSNTATKIKYYPFKPTDILLGY
jgi:hypothetical protein